MAEYYKIKAKEGGTLPANVILPPYKSDDKGLVISIDGSGFADRTEIESFIISENVKYIGTSAFSGCTGLTEMTIPAGVVSMGDSAFINCDKLTKIKVLGAMTGWPNNWNGNAEIDQQKYKITTNIKGSGTVTVLEESAAGSEIAVTVLANEGYQFKSIDFSVEDFNGSDGSYTFTMPAQSVVISVVFEKIVLQDAYFFYGDALQTETVITQENGAYCLSIGYFGTDTPATLYSNKPILKVQAELNGNWYDEEAWLCGTETVSINIDGVATSKYKTQYNGTGGAGSGDLVKYRFVF